MNKKQKPLGKSLDFVKKRIMSGMCGDMKNNHYSCMYEVKFKTILDMVECNGDIKSKGNIWEHNYIGLYDNEEKIEMKVIIEYNPDMKFEYFTSECCVCDGTAYFYFPLCGKILENYL